jgi:hypothetical protein
MAFSQPYGGTHVVEIGAVKAAGDIGDMYRRHDAGIIA